MLENQAYLHQHIAKLYRDVADQIATHGAPIVHELRRTDNYDDADAYLRWLSPDNLQPLIDQANMHDTWASRFFDQAAQIRTAEDALSGRERHERGWRNRME